MKVTDIGKIGFLVITVAVFTNCDIPNRDLLLVNKTDKKMSFNVTYDTLNLKSVFWNFRDYILPRDSIHPHLVYGGRGALENSIEKYSVDSSLYLYWTFKVIENKSDIEEIIRNRQYSRIKFNIKELKKANWTIRIK